MKIDGWTVEEYAARQALIESFIEVHFGDREEAAHFALLDSTVAKHGWDLADSACTFAVGLIDNEGEEEDHDSDC